MLHAEPEVTSPSGVSKSMYSEHGHLVAAALPLTLTTPD